METPLITTSDVAVLNAARLILTRVSTDAMRVSFEIENGFKAAGVGRFAHAADAAEHLIFDALSTAKHYADQELTETQLHNREPEPVS